MKYSIYEQEDYYGYIYLILDQKHNKIYIGQKKGKIEDSKNYYGSGKYIQNIIKSRGIYFLKKIILGVCYSKEEQDISEITCINLFQSYNFIYGYNITKGGTGGITTEIHPMLGKHHSKEAKQKISLNSKGMKGKNHSEETKAKQRKSAILRDNSVYKGLNKGKKHTEEFKQNCRERQTGKKISEETKNKLKKKIGKFDINNNLIKSYNSIKEAKIENKGDISSALKNNYKTQKLYYWKYL